MTNATDELSQLHRWMDGTVCLFDRRWCIIWSDLWFSVQSVFGVSEFAL